MRLMIAPALLAGLVLATPVSAQQYLPTDPPPNPHDVVPDQRLENVNQRLLLANDRLQKAAEDGDQRRIEQALTESREALYSVQDVVDNLPPDRREPYYEALKKTAQVLESGDPRVSATALEALRQQILMITAHGPSKL